MYRIEREIKVKVYDYLSAENEEFLKVKIENMGSLIGEISKNARLTDKASKQRVGGAAYSRWYFRMQYLPSSSVRRLTAMSCMYGTIVSAGILLSGSPSMRAVLPPKSV